MSDKNNLPLPPNFKNPFDISDPDKVWEEMKKPARPLTKEEEKLLRENKLSVKDLFKKD